MPRRRPGAGLRVPNNPERAMFMAHRVTGLALLAYFTIHATAMGLMFAGVSGAARVASFIVSNSWVRWVVAIILSLHGLNGIRLLLAQALAIGIGRPEPPKPPYISTSLRSGQRPFLYIVVVLVIVLAALAAYAVFWA